jgi:integrase
LLSLHRKGQLVSAALQFRNGTWRVLFRYKQRQYSYPVGKVDETDAQVALTKVRHVLGRLKAHLLDLPAGMDILTFIQHDGRPPDTRRTKSRPETTFAELQSAFLKTISNGAIEGSTLYTAKIHLTHLEETLGKAFPMNAVTLADLQRHIDRRRSSGPKQAKGKPRVETQEKATKKRKPLSAITIKKEIDTLRGAWNWAARMGYVEGAFPTGTLVYPKGEEKLPFMTWKEIERRIAAGGAPAQLWECLYLTTAEIHALLKYVRNREGSAWIYPMFLCAAHTGARRSELIRAKAEDVDLAGGTITIREKKRTRGMSTTRSVPLSKLLTAVLRDWMQERKAMPCLFGPGTKPMSPQAAQHAFERVLRGSKWTVLKGWHVLRHSFISALASRGIDQRIIDDFVGHQTDTQRRRYRHLYPSTKQKAINLVFA